MQNATRLIAAVISAVFLAVALVLLLRQWLNGEEISLLLPCVFAGLVQAYLGLSCSTHSLRRDKVLVDQMPLITIPAPQKATCVKLIPNSSFESQRSASAAQLQRYAFLDVPRFVSTRSSLWRPAARHCFAPLFGAKRIFLCDHSRGSGRGNSRCIYQTS